MSLIPMNWLLSSLYSIIKTSGNVFNSMNWLISRLYTCKKLGYDSAIYPNYSHVYRPYTRIQCQINQKRIITIQNWIYLTRFRKYFSVRGHSSLTYFQNLTSFAIRLHIGKGYDFLRDGVEPSIFYL